jgi:bifunctional DNA-binding transcriptional regulator/antitoxin component of YhaV-PrlF toxin-antitoxin module
MSLVKVSRAAGIALPAELWDALRVGEGDYLEAELVEGGVLLRPAPDARRGEAWRQVWSAAASVRPSPEQAAKPPDEQEADILAVVDEVRREYGDERRRS